MSATAASPPTPNPRDALRLMGASAAIGIPVSAIAFAYLQIIHEGEHLVWEAWPEQLGYDVVPWWWGWPFLLVGGLLVALVIVRLPGRGGHIPAEGTKADPTEPRDMLGVALAAAAGLIGGVVLGPEAPLIALGTGFALFSRRQLFKKLNDQAGLALSLAAACAAVAAIFGSPIAAVVLIIETVAIASPAAVPLVLMPCLLSTGIGALLFTGLGRWTGFDLTSLAVPPGVTAGFRPDVPDVLWILPIALVAGIAASAVERLAHLVVPVMQKQIIVRTLLAAAAVATLVSIYALTTGRGANEVALSGQTLLSQMVDDPQQWSTSALALLLLCKGLGYAISLGSFRGGPIFPALFLGAAFGVFVAPLPGLGYAAGLGIGMAAFTAAVMRLPLSAVVIVAVLLGTSFAGMAPLIVVASVVGAVTRTVIENQVTKRAAAASPSAT